MKYEDLEDLKVWQKLEKFLVKTEEIGKISSGLISSLEKRKSHD